MSTPVPPAPNPEYTVPTPSQPYRYTNPQNFSERMVNRIPAQARYVNLPGNAPRFLADRGTIFYSWMIAMAIVGWDEWHNLHILPRPARLWDTSLFYGILCLFAVSDALVPIANALAVGYTLTLLWQYYQGNITPGGGTTASTTTTNNTPSPVGSTASSSTAGQVVQPVANATGIFPTLFPGGTIVTGR